MDLSLVFNQRMVFSSVVSRLAAESILKDSADSVISASKSDKICDMYLV